MGLQESLIVLLHMLVFVFWVGGDLGAYISGFTLVDSNQDLKVRLYTLKLIDAVDLAPRSCLILAVPTGLSLALTKGWLDFSSGWLALVWVIGLIWLGIVWAIHFARPQSRETLKSIDYKIRSLVCVGLLASSIYIVFFNNELPMFIGLKLGILGVILLCGVFVRQVFKPLTVAIRDTIANGQSEENDRVIRHVIMKRSKPTVTFIWVLVLIAAWIGIATPV